ncbi:hypothetical protein DYBT9275_05439 [Dyadobacter sp. CECT 9275]|uniref:Uncharacterized protein n=1 Tax=Dyadobacter helix TaxID=2822344 RepID=A0A916JGW1_9BACT|nr:hypothetical protein DYBT9275_05439 [Dyadobacter sp. CECT 9275]
MAERTSFLLERMALSFARYGNKGSVIGQIKTVVNSEGLIGQ